MSLDESIEGEAAMNIDISGRTAIAALIAVSLFGCKPAGPPPDIIKTQREALQKARAVGAVEQKSADDTAKAAEEATK